MGLLKNVYYRCTLFELYFLRYDNIHSFRFITRLATLYVRFQSSFTVPTACNLPIKHVMRFGVMQLTQFYVVRWPVKKKSTAQCTQKSFNCFFPFFYVFRNVFSLWSQQYKEIK